MHVQERNVMNTSWCKKYISMGTHKLFYFFAYTWYLGPPNICTSSLHFNSFLASSYPTKKMQMFIPLVSCNFFFPKDLGRIKKINKEVKTKKMGAEYNIWTRSPTPNRH